MTAIEAQVGGRQNTLLGIAARLWWRSPGNILLVCNAIFIFVSGGGLFQTSDWIFWIVWASLVLVRYADIKFLDGCTTTGEPASITHWIRYAARLTACCVAAWVLAHVLGCLFATRIPHP